MQELGITFPGSFDLARNCPFCAVLDNCTGFALEKVPPLGLFQIPMFCGIAEAVAIPARQYAGGPQGPPGRYSGAPGLIFFQYQIVDREKRDRALNDEIQHGRAAMLGVFGAICHCMLDSTDHHFFYPVTHK